MIDDVGTEILLSTLIVFLVSMIEYASVVGHPYVRSFFPGFLCMILTIVNFSTLCNGT